MKTFLILAIGNILQKDDGVALYASSYLQRNFSFEPDVDIIQGGVEGINLLNLFSEYDEILLLDAIAIADEAGAIYHIPSSQLSGMGLNKSAHEVGVLECLDILELMGEKIPKVTLLGIVPASIKTEIGLSEALTKNFDSYIESVIKILRDKGFSLEAKLVKEDLKMIVGGFTSR